MDWHTRGIDLAERHPPSDYPTENKWYWGRESNPYAPKGTGF